MNDLALCIISHNPVSIIIIIIIIMILFHLNSFGFFPRFFVPFHPSSSFIRMELRRASNHGSPSQCGHNNRPTHTSSNSSQQPVKANRPFFFHFPTLYKKKKKMKTTKSVILSFIAESVDDICVIPIANNKKKQKKLKKHLFSL